MTDKITQTDHDPFILGGHTFTSRFILGSGKYSLDLIRAAVEQADAQIITLALRRANEGGPANILDYIPGHVTLLPNTSGARNADEAVRIARLARAAGCGDFVKIEVIRDAKYLLPDNTETVKATEILAKEGFVVMPYMYPDLNAARGMMQALPASCPWPPPSEPTKGCAQRTSSKSLLTRLTFQSLWTQESGARPRHARQWKWGRLPSWPTQPLQPQGTCLPWPMHSGWQLNPGGRLIWPGLDEPWISRPAPPPP